MGNVPENFHGKEGRSGRKTLAEELKMGNWLVEIVQSETDVGELEAKISSKKYSGKDVIKLKILKGNDRILNTTMNKLVPDLHEVTNKGSIDVNLSEKEKAEVLTMFPNAENNLRTDTLAK